MLARLAGRALWGTTKIAVKYVVVPIAYTAALAYLMDRASESLRDRASATQVHVDEELRPAP